MSASFRISLKGETLKEVSIAAPVYDSSDLSSVCEGLKQLRKLNQEVLSKIVEEDKLKNNGGVPDEKRCKLDDTEGEEDDGEMSE